ncbi:MAG: flagellar motor protein MotB, partial [Gammaproteobacteria bacterium]|nr:flagellar motor protein MotB [Gammaproteobacteria bacterium]
HSVERDDRSWLLPYIDLFTLLLTVFVVLLTYAEVFPGSHDSLRTSLPAANSTPVKEAQHSIEPPSDTPQIGEQIAPTPSQENLIGQQFQKLISDQGLEDLVDVNVEESRVNLQIKDSILFPLGEAGLTSPGTKVLSEIVKVLQDNPYRLSIVGHTDPLPIRTTRFPSNWELSTAR